MRLLVALELHHIPTKKLKRRKTTTDQQKTNLEQEGEQQVLPLGLELLGRRAQTHGGDRRQLQVRVLGHLALAVLAERVQTAVAIAQQQQGILQKIICIFHFFFQSDQTHDFGRNVEKIPKIWA